MLKAVTYSSFATPGLQPTDIENILRMSHHNNVRDAVTGALLFNGAIFVQVIEGPVEAIDHLVGRLKHDDRHAQIKFRDQRPLATRIFPNWIMGYVRLDGGWLEGQHDVMDAVSREMPEPIHRALMSLADTLPFD